jgi:hypothetical protein
MTTTTTTTTSVSICFRVLSLLLIVLVGTATTTSAIFFPKHAQKHRSWPRQPTTFVVASSSSKYNRLVESLRGGSDDPSFDDTSVREEGGGDNSDDASGTDVEEEEEWEEDAPTVEPKEEEEEEGETTPTTSTEVQDLDEEGPMDMAEEVQSHDESKSIFEEEFLVDEEGAVAEHEEDDGDDHIRLVGVSTTDGEWADDEGFDSISTPEDAAELAAVTAGGAVVDVVEEELAEGDANGDEKEDDDDDDDAAAGAVEVAVLSDEMKQVLREELRYTERDVLVMRPDIASEVIANRLARPTEGMPRNWYVEGTGPETSVRKDVLRLAGGVVVSAALAAAAYTVANRAGGDSPFDGTAILDKIKNIPKSIVSVVGQHARDKSAVALPGSSDRQETSSATATSDPTGSENAITEGEAKGLDEEVVHSIKPGTKVVPDSDRQDKSALDKFLTKIENLIKAFFNMKI